MAKRNGRGQLRAFRAAVLREALEGHRAEYVRLAMDPEVAARLSCPVADHFRARAAEAMAEAARWVRQETAETAARRRYSARRARLEALRRFIARAAGPVAPADLPAAAVLDAARRVRYCRGGRVRYVTVYAEWENYGGPEEGGWYYGVAAPVVSVSVRTLAAAARALVQLETEYPDGGGRYRSDVVHRVRAESKRGEWRSDRGPRPRYE
jgi:hypothetical protein